MREVRTLNAYWHCAICQKTYPPQIAVAVFEPFDTPDGKQDWRVKQFECLHHAKKG
jgi:hypothetical protein